MENAISVFRMQRPYARILAACWNSGSETATARNGFFWFVKELRCAATKVLADLPAGRPLFAEYHVRRRITTMMAAVQG
jgi:hypothetical protein